MSFWLKMMNISQTKYRCLFIENLDTVDNTDKIRAITNIILDIISIDPDDVRDAIKSITVPTPKLLQNPSKKSVTKWGFVTIWG